MADQSGPWLVFAFQTYYPEGGWDDFKSAHETLEDAEAGAAAVRAKGGDIGWIEHDYVQIVSVGERKVVQSWTLDRGATLAEQSVWEMDDDAG